MQKKKRIPNRETLRDMLGQGLSVKRIAAEYHVKKDEVKGWIRLAGLEKEWDDNRESRRKRKRSGQTGKKEHETPHTDKESNKTKGQSSQGSSCSIESFIEMLEKDKEEDERDGVWDTAMDPVPVECQQNTDNGNPDKREKMNNTDVSVSDREEDVMDINIVTKDDLERMYVKENHTSAELAAMFRIKPQAMRERLSRMGIHKQASHIGKANEKVPSSKRSNRLLMPDRATLRKLYITDNLSVAQIAIQYGVSKPTVYKWLRKENITGNTTRRGQNYPGTDRILADINKDKDANGIAREYNVTLQTAKNG